MRAVAVRRWRRPEPPISGWDLRLFWVWISCNSAAFLVLLTAIAVFAWLGADRLQLALRGGREPAPNGHRPALLIRQVAHGISVRQIGFVGGRLQPDV
ncbi:hypothetical protein ACXC9Q_30455 [Kribbella sp. CWNU-51]